MAPRQRVPILLLTGFLGSGKTSLLARWLREEAFAGAMVIVNELGEVGLDDRLIETCSDVPLLLDNGCACCAAGEDLSATLERLFFDRLHKRIPPFSWVLIETTGVADPAPILQRLEQGIVGERYQVRGLVCAFDARRDPWNVTMFVESRSQIDHADVFVLTKTDIAEDMQEARDCLECLRPGAPVLVSAHADLPATTLLAALEGRQKTACDPGHDHAEHTPDLTSVFAPLEGLDEAALRKSLRAALIEGFPAVLRLKGLVQLSSGDWVVVQATTTPDSLDITPAATGLRVPDRSGVTIIARLRPAAEIAGALTQGTG
jgi:G3E family GTPase